MKTQTLVWGMVGGAALLGVGTALLLLPLAPPATPHVEAPPPAATAPPSTPPDRNTELDRMTARLSRGKDRAAVRARLEKIWDKSGGDFNKLGPEDQAFIKARMGGPNMRSPGGNAPGEAFGGPVGNQPGSR